MADTKGITLSCLCGAATHTFTIPTSSLPLPSHLCNCTTSRRISGSLLTSYINITHDTPTTTSKKPDLTFLTPYPSSDVLTRWFCSTCGTHMYLEYAADGHFEAATGTLKESEGVVKYESCMWIEDTRDGGASQFVTHIDGTELKRYSRESGVSKEVALEWMDDPETTENAVQKYGSSDGGKEEGKKIHATCHCGGVEFYISPPNAESKLAASPFSDLIIPYHRQLDITANIDNHPWWVVGDKRFLAGTCACHSCRRASGFDITFWGFIPTSNITLDATGELPFTRDERRYWGTMKSYRSSPNVTRTFCGKCGANVFWDGDERPSIVDVAVGLLDAESGARAQELLAWYPERVSFEEDALNKSLIKGLGDGLIEWGRTNKGKEYVATGISSMQM
ncbi:hypothetical protein DM02DRAFT_619105 [Periconia macrospinosa]|uniref:CENP-V/GFA domain-containing protein n=1 Tax=Periconia macrospinosa TaxID=97972 RepID=A0A2V1D860_9PLEO|nr:hypothetical protein DM02DRAFT_619105 [Periconia macrospinosa]